MKNQLANTDSEFQKKVSSWTASLSDGKPGNWAQKVFASIAPKDDAMRRNALQEYIGIVCHSGSDSGFTKCAVDQLIDSLNSEAKPDDANVVEGGANDPNDATKTEEAKAAQKAKKVKDAIEAKARKLTQLITDLIHFAEKDKNKETPPK